MKIGIIGAGQVGSALGKGWAEAGHIVSFGVRDQGKYEDLIKLANISVKSIDDVTKTHDVIVLAIPGRVAGKLIPKLGDLKNKLVVDATNMFGMQKMMELAPEANFVKAFNHIGFEIMANPRFGDERAVLLICGNDKASLDTVSTMAIDLGFNPVIIGDATLASDLEQFALLWIRMSRKIGRNFAFKILQK